MGQPVPVRVGDVEFFVEVADGARPRTMGLDEVLSFEGVRDTVEAIATQLAGAWEKVRPSEASIEFGTRRRVTSTMTASSREQHLGGMLSTLQPVEL